MSAKRGITKDSNSHSTHDLVDGPAHHNYYERKGLRAAHRAINHFNVPFSVFAGSIPWLTSITGIPETNLRRWEGMLRGYPMWRPWYTYDGRHKRIISNDQDAALVSFVRDNFIGPGLLFTGSDFREIATNMFLTKYEDADPDLPTLHCSAGFITMFKAQHRLASRKIHFKRRWAGTDEQRQRWVASIQELFQTASWDRIISCDETSYLLQPNGIIT
jgi:hypothetical protein